MERKKEKILEKNETTWHLGFSPSISETKQKIVNLVTSLLIGVMAGIVSGYIVVLSAKDIDITSPSFFARIILALIIVGCS